MAPIDDAHRLRTENAVLRRELADLKRSVRALICGATALISDDPEEPDGERAAA